MTDSTQHGELADLAVWAIGAYACGAYGDGKSALNELIRRIAVPSLLPQAVRGGLVSILEEAENWRRSAPMPSTLSTPAVAKAALDDFRREVDTSPFLREHTRERLRHELSLLRDDYPEALIGATLVMRALAEVVVVVENLQGLDASLVGALRHGSIGTSILHLLEEG